MKKRLVLLLLFVVLVIYGCTGTGKLNRVIEDTTTDYQVPKDYNYLEQNIVALLEEGNTIGSRHYDELEASIIKLERDGEDTSSLRDLLGRLDVAGRQDSEEEYRPPIIQEFPEEDELEKRFIETKRMINVINEESDGIGLESYNKFSKELDEYEKEGLDIEDYKQTLNSFLIYGTEEHEAELQKNFPKVKQGLLNPSGCEGNGSFLLGTSPMRLEDLDRILPQGGMSGGHVTPIDHQYWNTLGSKGTSEDNLNQDKFDIIAPADGYIIDVEFREDHRVVIEHSCDFYTIFIHVDLLKDHILEQIEEQVGEIGVHEWPRVKVKEGEVFGSIGIGKVDFSVIDANVLLPGFNDPSIYDEKWKPYTMDTFDYFKEPLRSQLLEKNMRTAEPLGGKIDYDIKGKIVGNWFEEGSYGGTENADYFKGHLSIVYDSMDPDHIVVSIGEFDGRASQFGVKTNSPDPKDIGVGQLVKYELVPYDHYIGNRKWEFSEFSTELKAKNQDEVRGVALFQLEEDRKLKIEFFPGKKGSQVSGFTSNSKIYER